MGAGEGDKGKMKGRVEVTLLEFLSIKKVEVVTDVIPSTGRAGFVSRRVRR